jgi:regulatory protein YycI of two-component signal transduction system YycFG
MSMLFISLILVIIIILIYIVYKSKNRHSTSLKDAIEKYNQALAQIEAITREKEKAMRSGIQCETEKEKAMRSGIQCETEKEETIEDYEEKLRINSERTNAAEMEAEECNRSKNSCLASLEQARENNVKARAQLRTTMSLLRQCLENR